MAKCSYCIRLANQKWKQYELPHTASKVVLKSAELCMGFKFRADVRACNMLGRREEKKARKKALYTGGKRGIKGWRKGKEGKRDVRGHAGGKVSSSETHVKQPSG